jgi:hypothetical protein
MLAEDVPVWYRFLEQWGHLFKNLYYDVCVGGVTLSEEKKADPMWRMWRATTAKRIDALAETPTETWIIEVADRPGLRALGQLQVYRSLWIEDPKILKPEKMVLVCQDLDTDLGAAAAQNGVLLYVMPLTR